MQVPFGVDKGHERWSLSRSGVVSVRVLCAEFDRWNGPPPASTWRKPVVGPPARPFAELAVAHELAQAGWVSGWVHRSGHYLSAWEPRLRSNFPTEALGLIAEISAVSREKAGCWDVYAWRDGMPLFAELKWPRDRIRPSQRIWMDSAIQLGVSPDCFFLVDCKWRQPISGAADKRRP